MDPEYGGNLRRATLSPNMKLRLFLFDANEYPRRRGVCFGRCRKAGRRIRREPGKDIRLMGGRPCGTVPGHGAPLFHAKPPERELESARCRDYPNGPAQLTFGVRRS